MPTLDVWPARAQLRPGESLSVRVRSDGLRRLGLRCVDGGAVVSTATVPPLGDGIVTLPLPSTIGRAGFAIELIADDASGERATSAIDVAPHWSAAPRYGFMSDFDPTETLAESTRRADQLLQLHINAVQFYDWMASHYEFFAPTETFTDPLGRQLSHAVVRRKVELVQARGMAAIAYGALYGAERDFALAHPDWLLYDGRRDPIALAGLFYLQDFSERSPWREHILGQYAEAIERLGFEGIHVDQYGMPKRALSRAGGAWRELDVGATFGPFVEAAARRVAELRPDGGTIFNCVNAWPLEAMAEVSADAATYIEVWEPHSNYRNLYELVRRARLLRPDKAVILAAYLRPFHPDLERTAGALTAFRLASATIAASGGFHLICGEGDGILTEAYYPRYGHLGADALAIVRRYADFAVRNTVRLHDPSGVDAAWTSVGPTNDVITLAHPALDRYGAGAATDTLWVVARDAGSGTVLQFVNLRGLATDAWNAEQPSPPRPLEGVEVRVRVCGDVGGVWWDTPDDEVGLARPLRYEVVNASDGRFLIFALPRIEVWSSVWWSLDGEGGDDA
jgi:dextranase